MQLSMPGWGRLMAEGKTTYAVGPVAERCAVFDTRAEAEQAAEHGDRTFIQWDGHHGHQVTVPEYELEAGA